MTLDSRHRLTALLNRYRLREIGKARCEKPRASIGGARRRAASTNGRMARSPIQPPPLPPPLADARARINKVELRRVGLSGSAALILRPLTPNVQCRFETPPAGRLWPRGRRPSGHPRISGARSDVPGCRAFPRLDRSGHLPAVLAGAGNGLDRELGGYFRSAGSAAAASVENVAARCRLRSARAAWPSPPAWPPWSRWCATLPTRPRRLAKKRSLCARPPIRSASPRSRCGRCARPVELGRTRGGRAGRCAVYEVNGSIASRPGPAPRSDQPRRSHARPVIGRRTIERRCLEPAGRRLSARRPGPQYLRAQRDRPLSWRRAHGQRRRRPARRDCRRRRAQQAPGKGAAQ